MEQFKNLVMMSVYSNFEVQSVKELGEKGIIVTLKNGEVHSIVVN